VSATFHVAVADKANVHGNVIHETHLYTNDSKLCGDSAAHFVTHETVQQGVRKPKGKHSADWPNLIVAVPLTLVGKHPSRAVSCSLLERAASCP
jgi:hypothetical protein